VGVGVGTGNSPSDGLIVLGDLDSNGSFDRGDVRAFLYGASVDTTAFNSDPGTAVLPSVSGETAADRVARNRMANGTRLGQLRKNAAVLSYNAEVTALGGAASERFNRFDVNNDGVVSRADAQAVDRSVGRNYTNFDDVLTATDDLVAAELGDDNAITHVDPNAAAASGVTQGNDLTFTSQSDLQSKLGNDSDFQQVRKFLGNGGLLDGDTNFDGDVDFADFQVLDANFLGGAGKKWSLADFNFDGQVTFSDFQLLDQNFGQTAGGASIAFTAAQLAEVAAFREAVVPEPATGVLLAALGFGLAGGRRRRRPARTN
jgi:hypothetical protein